MNRYRFIEEEHKLKFVLQPVPQDQYPMVAQMVRDGIISVKTGVQLLGLPDE